MFKKLFNVVFKVGLKYEVEVDFCKLVDFVVLVGFKLVEVYFLCLWFKDIFVFILGFFKEFVDLK